MNMIDCMIDEFHDEAIVKGMEDREITSWLEIRNVSLLQVNHWAKFSSDWGQRISELFVSIFTNRDWK